ncbi:MAG: FAD-binding and (Fe-S)-binding domain-containing protein, partial [Streptosporangiaceae bacterium]
TSRPTGGSERWPGWEDAAVPVEQLAGYLHDFTELMTAHGRHGSLYGHFGEGCVHVRIDHDLLTDAGRRAYRRFQEDAADLVVAHHGSLSGEHGDGRQRSELLTRMYSPDLLAAFAEFKQIFDPANVLNPGVIVDPAPLDAALRPEVSREHSAGLAFSFAEDGGDFGRVARRCVGVGACRAAGGGMCPSYQATRDERHSTRGRARILFEMLDGHLRDDGWRSDEVMDALDLCLMCKACSNECPVSVDMATYKAEFLHQHYRNRLRPRAHLSMGFLPVWLAVGRRCSRLLNAMVASAPAARALKRLAGIDQRRALPPLAEQPVRRGALAGEHGWRLPANGGRQGAPRGRVLLWLDSFTTRFAPEVVTDAIRVLSAVGYDVEPVGQRLCCGLTWVSTGQLGVARRVMARTVRRLAGSDLPVVVLEPSCAAALRDDVVKLLASEAARSLAARVRTLAEMLEGVDLAAVVAEQEPDPADRSVLAQFHCHQRAALGTRADQEVLALLGYAVTSVDEGCCGLAGNFGFEDGHYEVSATCAEQSFLPYVHADPAAIVLADGFSCRLQIEQLGEPAMAGRRPLHLAQLVARRLK